MLIEVNVIHMIAILGIYTVLMQLFVSFNRRYDLTFITIIFFTVCYLFEALFIRDFFESSASFSVILLPITIFIGSFKMIRRASKIENNYFYMFVLCCVCFIVSVKLDLTYSFGAALLPIMLCGFLSIALSDRYMSALHKK